MPGAPTAAVFGAGLVLAGLGFGSPSLLVPGIGLLGLAIVAVVWVRLATPSRLVRTPGPSRVVEEEPFPLRIRAVGGLLPPPGGELTDPVLERPVKVGIRWRRSLALEVSLRGRGRLRLEPARLVIRDPIGLCTCEVESEDGGELLILPRIEPLVVAGRGAGGSSVLAGLDEGPDVGRLDARAIELEIDGLRPHRQGSPASRIHWPTVARTGELVERRLVAGGDTAPLVVLDAGGPASSDALDLAVRAATSLCWHLSRTGGCAILLPGDRRPSEVEPERGWPQAHARLALVEPVSAPPPLAAVHRAGAVFWVTARARPVLPAAVRSSGVRYLVGPSVRGHGAPAFLVASCEGRRIGGRVANPLRRVA
ncbi:MAG: hypothetical protein QOI10_3324 [Solirubrobacterales bacterium]|jgi:uncharacterized protein (DUF58 family)|nr:hypothetical protein [Solirubrobacterales bacterium]